MQEKSIYAHEQAEVKFEYSPENPPPLEVLESKIYAIHATPIFPQNGVMIAGARDTNDSNKWLGEEPPSFRPTLHFSLGAVVEDHGNGRYSWRNHPFAVVVSLQALKRQLVNVYPNDTFILGNYQLTEDSMILVPFGTDTSSLPQTVQVVHYDKKVGIHQAVDQLVKEKNGWKIQMEPEGTETGSIATIDGVDINNPNFFNSLFEELPHVSYGTHATSERGEACRFGAIEGVLHTVINSYEKFGPRYGLETIQFYRIFLEHNLSLLKDALTAQNLSPIAMNTFEQKVVKVNNWLNVIDVDIELREKFGRSLTGTGGEISTIVKKNKHNIDLLRKLLIELVDQLPETPKYPPSASDVAEIMRGFSFDELTEFIQNNKSLFERVDMVKLYTEYAVRRWCLIEINSSERTDLEQMLETNLPNFGINGESEFEPVLKHLERHLSTGTNRLSTALQLLRKPYIREHLKQKYGILFEDGQPATLDDLLRAHPVTKNLFQSTEQVFTGDQAIGLEFLTKTGMILRTERSVEESLNDFIAARITAFEITWTNQQTKNDIAALIKPLNAARKWEDMLVGTEITVCEKLRKEVPPLKLWMKLGLEKEYRQIFPKDNLFWESDRSMLDIYKELSMRKQDQTSLHWSI